MDIFLISSDLRNSFLLHLTKIIINCIQPNNTGYYNLAQFQLIQTNHGAMTFDLDWGIDIELDLSEFRFNLLFLFILINFETVLYDEVTQLYRFKWSCACEMKS